ncbi:MAG: Amuc_1100 family pilus-like protein [Candidatus Omnitrophota bacterium]
MANGIKSHIMTKVALGVLFLVSLGIAVLVGLDRISLKRSIEGKTGELDNFRSEGLGNLNRERLRLERQMDSLNSVNERMSKGLFSKPVAQMPKDVGDALKFKEELYRVQKNIKDEGAPIDFQFPFWLGFERYEHDIPAPGDLPVRVKQLDIIAEIIDLMLQSKIPEVSSVEFLESKVVVLEGEKDPLFRNFPVRISFECKNDNLVNFMYKLYSAGIPFRIEMIKAKTVNEDMGEKGALKVEMIIVAAVRQQENK